MPVNNTPRKFTGSNKFTKSQEITHLMYIDNIKLSTINEKESETLIQAIKIYS